MPIIQAKTSKSEMAQCQKRMFFKDKTISPTIYQVVGYLVVLSVGLNADTTCDNTYDKLH